MIVQDKKQLEKDASILGYFTRDNPRNYVPVYAGMSPRGVFGSGELTMATNVAGGLRDAGLNAVLYNPVPEKLRGRYAHLRRHSGLSPEQAMLEVMSGFKDPAEAAREARLYRLGHNYYTMSPIEALKGKSLKELMEAGSSGEFEPVLRTLFGSTPGETRQNFVKFKKLLDNGAFDGITPGGLRDHLFRGRDAILNGRVVVGDPRKLWDPANAGKGGSYFNGALGMGYSDMPYGKKLTVGNGRDLGDMTGFDANYRPGDARPLSESVIPFTDVGRKWYDRIPGISRLRELAGRRALARYMSSQLGVDPSTLLGKKLVLLSGGASGENIALKMKQVHDAIGGRNDVAFLVNAGGNPSVYADAEALARQWNSSDGGARYALSHGFTPTEFRRFARAADLNLAYPGSSSLSETLASRNPYVFMRDTPLNERNIGWAHENFMGVPSFDSSGMAAKEFASSLGAHGQNEGFFWRDSVGTKHVNGPLYNARVPGLQKNPELGSYRPRAIIIQPDANKKQFAEMLSSMLDHPEQYRAINAGNSSRFINALDSANRRVASTAAGANGGLYLGSMRLPNWVLRFGGLDPTTVGNYQDIVSRPMPLPKMPDGTAVTSLRMPYGARATAPAIRRPPPVSVPELPPLTSGSKSLSILGRLGKLLKALRR